MKYARKTELVKHTTSQEFKAKTRKLQHIYAVLLGRKRL
jgi:hypothetical protein